MSGINLFVTHRMAEQKKLRIGWFSFTCCEDSTVIFTELMNDHYMVWKHVLDIRNARVLQTKNYMDQMDVAFVEGAITAPDQEAKLLEIRSLATRVVAIGACAVTGMPSGHRNTFSEEQDEKIAFILDKFHYGDKVKRLDEIITVDAVVPGCPMVEATFLKVVNDALVEFNIPIPEVRLEK